MKKKLITFASCEDRFLLGSMNFLTNDEIDSVTIFYSKKYAEETSSDRMLLTQYLVENNIHVDDFEVDFDCQITTWSVVKNYFECNKFENGVIVDISTMPREIIWYFFFILKNNNIPFEYIYSKPERYDNWLTEDTCTPRLVLKLSGVADLSKRTCLIIIPGFDFDRTDQVFTYFEPDVAYLAVQRGRQYNNETLNIQMHKKFASEMNMNIIYIDCYDTNTCDTAILKVVKKHIKQHNIILASLGPKISAVTLFSIAISYPEVALCYAPSKKVNMHYSFGYLETIRGSITKLR